MENPPVTVREVFALFLRLGFTAFGGPLAHVALMEDAVVARRGWLTRERFADLVGATALIPGPNSTEVAMHVGLAVAGWRGFWAAGLAFVLPSVGIVLGLAWAYGAGADLPVVHAALRGMQPVIVAVIAQALWRLGPAILVGPRGWGLATGVALLAGGGVPEVPLLFGAAALGLALAARREGAVPPLAVVPAGGWGLLAGAPVALVPVGLWPLFWVFFKTGALLFGSGYVLVAYLHADLVQGLHWLTEDQLLDAIAIGHLTPGPLSSTATFIGYQLAGLPGAAVATLGMFAPAFFFVAVSAPWVAAMRASPRWAGLLDGANAAALALMAVAAMQLAKGALFDGVGVVTALLAAFALIRWRLNPLWPMAVGALLGVLTRALPPG